MMKTKRLVCILLISALLLAFAAGGFAAPGDGGEASFDYSVNRVRVFKNRFYNRTEAALAEDTALAKYLYSMFDFVYGDAMLDAFAGCMQGAESFAAHIKALGFESCIASTDGRTRASAAAVHEGKLTVFIAEFGEDGTSAVLRRVGPEGESVYSWRFSGEVLHLQYLYPEPDGSGFFTGYRAEINEDGTGRVVCGVCCSREAMNAFTVRGVESLISLFAAGGDEMVLTDTTVTVTVGGTEHTHTIGDTGEEDAGD